MERFQKKLHKKVRDVEKKKDEIRGMYQDSLEENLKVINSLKELVKQKINEIAPPQTDGINSMNVNGHLVAPFDSRL